MRLSRLPHLLCACALSAVCAAGLAAAPEGRGLQLGHMDTQVKPCDDFFLYANGAWLRGASIPGDQSTWGAFQELREANSARLKAILEELAARKDWPKGSPRQKVADFYASGMDTAAIEAAGLKPLDSRLKAIAGLKDAAGLARLLGSFHLENIGGGFAFGVGQDDKNSNAYIAQMAQGGLGLPDRDYYTREDEPSRALRAKYLEHVERVFVLMGEDKGTARRHARTVMDMETRLAKASMTRVEQRDPNAIYHKLDRKTLAKAAPAFPWATYFKELGLPESEKDLLVRQPKFFKEFSAMVAGVPMADWKTYLRWNLVRDMSGALPSAFEQESFAFYDRTLTGTTEMRARWKRVQAVVDGAMGEALGQAYVEKHFSPEAKKKALELVENLRAALRERIKGLDWMTAPTKVKALAKLDAFMVKIGYPDRWRDYSALQVDRGSYAENVLRASAFESRRGLAKLGQPIDRAEWGMTPPTVNAYYNPSLNEIVFPAGILQAPFFDPEADDAVNYGGIGMVIGHEMTHGFDDEGCQYDAQGNLASWWTPEDTKAYASRLALVEEQYAAYEALPGLKLNGKLTLGENVADLGGLKIAYAAWRRSLEGKPAPQPAQGFTPEQRFFLGYAQSWHFVGRPEAIRLRVQTDPHSPAMFRVNGPLANLPEFIQAFGCGEDGKMVRPAGKRPAIW